jgi:predicted membrane metal-binding protein
VSYVQPYLTGTSHIIVISGSNIAVVASVLLLLEQRLSGKRVAPPISIIGIVIYTFLVGADGAVSRAAIMGIVWVVGRSHTTLNVSYFGGGNISGWNLSYFSPQICPTNSKTSHAHLEAAKDGRRMIEDRMDDLERPERGDKRYGWQEGAFHIVESTTTSFKAKGRRKDGLENNNF